jgi:hypothetical protein
MAVEITPYESLGELLVREPIAEEDAPTAKIIKRLKHARVDKELSRGEFLDICYWKSPRGIRRCEKNSATKVEQTTQRVFATRSEEQKIELLTSLEGVSIPTASAILTLTDPANYGVIDIRVWQLLHQLKSVTSNPGGQNFSFRHWCDYLQILRHHSRRLKMPARLIELTLFQYHREHQLGPLYGGK